MIGEAFTRLADGTLIRWHAKPLAECRRADCERYHVSKPQLNLFVADEWWDDYAGDDPAIRDALGLDGGAA